MAGNIKGITIELNGDTTKLDRALRKVEKDDVIDRSFQCYIKETENIPEDSI